MGISKRSMAGVMAAAILMAVCLPLTSCKTNKAEAKKISEDDPWYDTKKVVLDPGFDPDAYKMIEPSEVYMCHDKYAVTYYLQNKGEEDEEYLLTDEHLMCIFDNEGTLLHTVDLDGIMSACPAVWNVYFIRQCYEVEDGIRFYFSDTFRNIYYTDIDENTGLQTGSPKQLDLKALGLDPNDALEEFEIIGDYLVMTFGNVNSAQTTLAVAKDGVPLYKADVDKELGPGELVNINSFFGGGDGTVLIRGTGKTDFFGKLDLATGHMTKITDAKPITSNISTSIDGKGYLTKATGVFEYDSETCEEISRFNFDNCNINRFESEGVSVISVNDDKVVLSYQALCEDYFRMVPPPAAVYTFEKADKNPNAGKTVITVASLDGFLTMPEGKALQMFNDQNSDYYAHLVIYDINDYVTTGDSTTNIDEKDRQAYSAMAMASGSLISDIRSGTGPDIILGASNSIDLLDSTYLTDLTPYLKRKDFDASKYYMNVIEASKMDGKSFFIPTAFSFTGIVTDRTKLGDGKKGFTYEQYASFVREQLNGVEPVTQKTSRVHFMNLCLQAGYTDWLKNDKVDFDRKEFRDMAGFFREYVPEGITETSAEGVVVSSHTVFITSKNATPKRGGDRIRSYDDNDPEEIGESQNQAVYAVFVENLSELSLFATQNYFGDNMMVTGLPSDNGTGPSANIISSFSITEGSPVEDGAYAFLDVLLSDDVQVGAKYGISVNRAATLEKLERETQDCLEVYEMYKNTPPSYLDASLEETIRMAGGLMPDSKVPDFFLETVENIDSVMISDNSVLMIVSEEIPPYLIGQKDIDSVISVINSRTQIVYDER